MRGRPKRIYSHEIVAIAKNADREPIRVLER